MMLISPYPDLFPVVLRTEPIVPLKMGSVHVPNCKSFLDTEAGRKHAKRRAVFQQHGDAITHLFFPARQTAEGNSRLSDKDV